MSTILSSYAITTQVKVTLNKEGEYEAYTVKGRLSPNRKREIMERYDLDGKRTLPITFLETVSYTDNA